MRQCVNNRSLISLILYVDYIERVTGMKPTKSCLCRWTVTVVMERWQNNFYLY